MPRTVTILRFSSVYGWPFRQVSVADIEQPPKKRYPDLVADQVNSLAKTDNLLPGRQLMRCNCIGTAKGFRGQSEICVVEPITLRGIAPTLLTSSSVPPIWQAN